MSYRSSIKTAVKKYLRAVQEKPEDARDLLSRAMSLLQKGVSKGVVHKNTASRTIARLSGKISAPSAAA